MPTPTLLLGDESFLVEEAVRKMQADHAHLTPTHFDEKFDWDALNNAITAVSLFGDQHLIMIRNPWFLTGTANDDDIKAIKAMLKTFESSAHEMVIYVIGKSVDQRRKGFTTLKKAADVQVFNAFKDWEMDKVMDWIHKRVKGMGKTLDNRACDALAQACGSNLRMLASELDKLSVYVGDAPAIQLEDVQTLCTGASASIFNLNEAMKTANRRGMLEATTTLLDHGDDPIKLMGLMTFNLRLYIQIFDFLNRGASMDTMGKALGKNPFFLKRLVPELKQHYSYDSLRRLYANLAEKDLEVKSGKISSKAAIESFVLSI